MGLIAGRAAGGETEAGATGLSRSLPLPLPLSLSLSLLLSLSLSLLLSMTLAPSARAQEPATVTAPAAVAPPAAGPEASPPVVPAEVASASFPAACALGPVRSATVRGCGSARCRDPEFTRNLLSVAELVPGIRLDERKYATLRNRLEKLGFFRKVDIGCTGGPEGIDVILDVSPMPKLRRIRVSGQDHFYQSQIVDRLPLQAGDPLDPDDPTTADITDRIRDTIRRMYLDDGYTSTDVRTGLTGDGEDVDLDIEIREGSRSRIEAVDIALHSVRALPSLRRDEERCPVIRARDLRNWAGLTVGHPFTERTSADAVRRLTRALRGIGFAGVRARTSYESDTRRFRMDVTYESCYLIRFFERDSDRPGQAGYRPATDEGLVNVLPFGDSGVFDLTEATLGREEVRIFYENRGFLLANVVLDYRTRAMEKPVLLPDAQVRPGDRPWAPEVAGRITYLVTRNPRVEIRNIRIVGNKTLPDDDIRAVMRTEPYDFFGGAGAVLPEQVFFDLDRIRTLYAENGFRDVAFRWAGPAGEHRRTWTTEGLDTVWTWIDGARAFRIRKPPSTHGVYVEIGIEEGPRTTLGQVEVQGVEALPANEVRRELGLETGGAYSLVRVRDAANRLARRLSAEGFLGVTIDVTCAGHDPEVPAEECQLDRISSHKVDLALKVTEGTRAVVGPLFVDGTRRTADAVVLRDFPQPGMPYSAERVASAVRLLKDLGIFSSVQVQAVGADEQPPSSRPALVVRCREARSRFVDLAGGFESLDREMEFPGYVTSPVMTAIALQDRSTQAFGRALGIQIPDILLTAEVRYTDLNFLGRAKRLYLPFKYGLSATAWDRYAAFVPTYVDPRFFVRGLSFRVTPFAVYDRATSALDIIQFGSEFALSKELLPRLFGTFSYSIAEVKTRRDGEDLYSPFRLENKVIPVLTWDRLDHPLNPTRGGWLQGSLSYINAMASGGSLNHFLKWEVSGKLFWSLRKLFTFGVMARYGASQSYGTDSKLPQEERFSLGGNRGVRGFSNDAIGQYDDGGNLRLERTTAADGTETWGKPYGGDIVFNGSAEIRFPLLRKLSLNAALFYDVGALAETVSQISGQSFRHSIGVGIRLLLGNTIPIRLDYGLILDRRCREVDSTTGQCVATEEYGNIHFGILYTF